MCKAVCMRTFIAAVGNGKQRGNNIVLVSYGYYHKVPQTYKIFLDGLKQQPHRIIASSWKLSLKSRCQQDNVFSETSKGILS